MLTEKQDIKSFRELRAYQAAFLLQQAIFRQSSSWPREETYSLTDQVRRSSRSIGANLAEAWGKRRYPAHFRSKLSDADGEIQETLHWLATVKACGYLSSGTVEELETECLSVGRMIGSMIARHETFCLL
jgi:four helix bundle protein